jgi:hypothetical protein
MPFSPFQIASADFHSEDVAIDKNFNNLTMSDDAGVEVNTTPTGRYNTDIKKQSVSDESGVEVKATPTGQYKNAEKYKVKRDKKFSPGCA